ncbi:ribonuclease H-like domain-containing protein [Tanacetum coccineum]
MPQKALLGFTHLKDLFHDNKDSQAINLDNELRSIKIGKMTVNEYCTKIKSMANRLKNLDYQISEKNLVIYAVNGLDSHFATLVEIIRHREPLPTFETVRNMLLLKVSSFDDQAEASTMFESSSSSPTILMATSDPDNKGKSQNLPQLCHHFNKGTCRFGDRCKFIHDNRNRMGLNTTSRTNNNSYTRNNAPSVAAWGQNRPSYNRTAHQPAPTRTTHPQNTQAAPPILYQAQPQPVIYQAQKLVYQVQQPDGSNGQTTSNNQGILRAGPALYPFQPTSLPSAFSTMSLQDPTWNMDTGATSHLNSNARNLSTLFNKRLFSSIHVGDGNSIPVTNTGHSIIPSYHRPLHLHNVLVTPNIIKNLISVRQFTRDNNCTIEFDTFGFSVKDFLTRHILLRCDSSGDLYPVTKPSTLPAAFVSTSSTTWHQRLGYPGDEVLRSLNSRQFISCNKAKSTHHKFHADGMLSHYKARLVANGSSQQLGADFDETFSLVVKPATICTVLSLAVSRQWPIHQLDVKNAFFNGDLSERVYMHQPPGFVDSRYPNHVCLLQCSLYGLKQAPRAWFQRFAGYATRAGFSSSRCDSSLFIFTQGSQVAYLLIYVDDIILSASSPILLQQIVDSLHKEFDMTDLRALNYFLGISVVRHPTGLFLSQKKYALQLLEHAHMVNCNPSRTPVDTDSKLDLSYAVQQVCLYMHDPRELHFAALKRILRYVQGTLELGLHLYASATTSLVGYTDADWAGYPSTRRSTFGYCVFLGDNLLSWSAKRQHTISHSSAEAEYQGVANVVAETAWIHNLFHELHSPLLTATLVYCDNVSAVYMSANLVQHQRTKHIEIDIHFVCDMVKAGHVRVLHVPSRF